jgi:hypothetical protein
MGTLSPADLTRRIVSLRTERTLTIDDSKTRGKRRRGVLGGLENEGIKFWRVKYCTILSLLCKVTALYRWLAHTSEKRTRILRMPNRMNRSVTF